MTARYNIAVRWLLAHVPRREARAALLSLSMALVLLLAKLFAYLLTGSAAIFSDALETTVNVAAAGFAIYSLSLAHKPADPDHPYGHGKIEFFAGGHEIHGQGTFRFLQRHLGFPKN